MARPTPGKVPPSALKDGDQGNYDTVESAAIAGLRSVTGQDMEYGGGILQNKQSGKYAYTQPVGQGQGSHFGARVQVPQGWQMSATFHTHPNGPNSTNFSGDDVNMAQQLKMPSYILPYQDNTIRKFDPADRASNHVYNSGDPDRAYAPGVSVTEGPIPDGVPKAHPGTVLQPVQQPTRATGVPISGSKMSPKAVNPTVPTGPTTNSPTPPTEVADMAHFHRLATSGKLADLLFKLGGGKR